MRDFKVSQQPNFDRYLNDNALTRCEGKYSQEYLSVQRDTLPEKSISYLIFFSLW